MVPLVNLSTKECLYSSLLENLLTKSSNQIHDANHNASFPKISCNNSAAFDTYSVKGTGRCIITPLARSGKGREYLSSVLLLNNTIL